MGLFSRKPDRKLKLAELIADGENPKGFIAQTPNGTAKDYGTGWNKQYDFGDSPQAEAGGAWQTPNSNRTGE